MATTPSDPFRGNTAESQMQQPTQQLAKSAKETEETTIPPGYKQTEVGVIPEDWETPVLASITEANRPISYGIVQTGPNVAGGIRCLRVLDIDAGRINRANLITTSKRINASYKRTILEANDLVMPLRGKVGDVGIIDRDLVGCNLTRGVALIAIRPEWSARFCKQAISSNGSRSRLKQSMNGSALQEIPIATLRSFKLPLPPTKAEQEAIAEALSDADALIESLEQLLTKKRQIKQGAMQELLTGKTRLPEFRSSGTGGCIHKQGIPIGYKHIEAGMIPSEWQAMRVGALFGVGAGGDLDLSRSSSVQSDSYPYPIYANSLSQKGLYGFCNYAESQSGSITVTARGTLGKSFYRNTPFTAIGRLLILEPKVSMDARFFSEYINYGVHFAVESTGVPQLTAPQVARYLLPVPSEPEQRAIATVLSDMDAEIAALERRRDKTFTIKQGMMQQLLTGRVRLIVPHQTTASA